VSRAPQRVVLVELGAAESAAAGLGRALRDAGVEVVYAGRLRTCAQVTSTVEQEDPDAVGLAVDVTTDSELLEELVAALSPVRVFGWGSGAARPLDRVFSEETQVTEWLAGGATHTVPAPSDRIR
jgi:NADP-dependent 3-hydroxy acid dehydrogenase YdfG